MISETSSLILRSLAVAVAMPDLFGAKASKLAPVLDTLAALAELPAALEPERKALLDMVDGWVRDGREPSDAELDVLRSQRNELDQRARDLLSGLPPKGEK